MDVRGPEGTRFGRHRLNSLRKNSDLSYVLKGCGFQPHRKSCKKINLGFSREGMVPT
jgi:hypothetical protein